MRYFFNFFLITLVLLSVFSCRRGEFVLDDTKTIKDNGEGVGTTTWTKDHEYILDGFVFVNDGQVLTIEAGTVIRAKTGQTENASALIVARGGKIIANGNAVEPIIFTVEGDDLQGSVPIKAKGLWGGLIILGNAPINAPNNENNIEGIPIYEPRGVYGGYDPDDNSGILQYVSIRHGGTNIGEGNEINGLTLGGVGRKTIINHVEVISNSDDGFEMFGGTVNCQYLVASFCGDDAFDFDEGYQGKLQFIVGIQDQSLCDHLAEHDGNADPNATPITKPLIFNATFIGGGNGANHMLISFMNNGAGLYNNSLFVDQTQGVYVEYVKDQNNSFEQLDEGNLKFRNNIFYNISDNSLESICKVFNEVNDSLLTENDYFLHAMHQWENTVQDAGIGITDDSYNILPNDTAYSFLTTYPPEGFKTVNFKGAFGSDNWLNGWTLIDESGYIR
jgi:hypothetical protein